MCPKAVLYPTPDGRVITLYRDNLIRLALMKNGLVGEAARGHYLEFGFGLFFDYIYHYLQHLGVGVISNLNKLDMVINGHKTLSLTRMNVGHFLSHD